MSSTHPANTTVLLADIGGTNTRVALASGTRLLPETIRRYRNAEYAGLDAVLARYLAEEGGPDCAGACVAAAGPVRDGVATLTNLDWTIDPETVARAAQAETVSVLNDLQAQGHALGHLPPAAMTPVAAGKPAPDHATRLVIGIGTGFNCAPVYETPHGRFVAPAEAGHITLPVRDAGGLTIATSIARAHGFASVEEALSGRGLANLYRWASEDMAAEAAAGTAGSAGTDGASALPASDAILAAARNGDPVATRALTAFVHLFGAVVGDLSLVHLPYGGVYLVGGMARAVAPWLEPMGFGRAMQDKGRFSGLLADIPVAVVDDDYAALTGCAHHLADLIG